LLSGKQSRELTASHEHYLRAIWEVRSQQGYARLADVARELGVAPSTLSVGLRPLESRGLLTHDPRRFLVLTEEGERLARQVHHRFAVMRVFLRDVLGIPGEESEKEACLLEHDVSAETAEKFLDVVKLLNEDAQLRELLHHRLSEFRRKCVRTAECSTCDLNCLTGEKVS
jgi:Mn-dependent DtxR family transcriptional regulator